MRRLAKFLFIAVPIMLLLLAATVQVVLWSDLPRRIVAAGIQRETGLDVHLGGLRATWGGRVTVRDLRLSLPMEDQPLLTVPAARIHHTSLLALATGSAFQVISLEADEPGLRLVRDVEGRWNLERLAALLERPAPPTPRDPAPLPPLPRVALKDVSVSIIDADGTNARLSDISVDLRPTTSAAGELAARLPGLGSIDGRLTTRGELTHEFTIDVTGLRELSQLLPDQRLETFALRADWSGRVEGGTIRGRLTIDHARTADGAVHGRVDVDLGEGGITARPRALVVTAPRWLPEPATVSRGRVDMRGGTVTWQELTISTFDGRIALNGDYHMAQQRGQVSGAWERLAFPVPLVHGGGFEAAIHRDDPFGDLQLTAEVHSHGTAFDDEMVPLGAWDTRLAASATGATFTDLRWELRELAGAWRGGVLAAETGKITAAGTLAEGVLHVERFTVPARVEDHGHGRMGGSGRFNLATRRWNIEGRLEGLRSHHTGDAEGEAAIEASGGAQRAEFRLTQLHMGPWSGSLAGNADFSAKPQISLDYNLAHDAVAFDLDGRRLAATERASVTGKARGTLMPLALSHRSTLLAEQLVTGDGPAQRLEVVITGKVDDKSAGFETEPFALMGSKVSFSGTHRLEDAKSGVSFRIEGLALEEVDRFTDAPMQLRGTVGLELDLAMSRFDPDTLTARGTWRADRPGHPLFEADDASGSIHLHEGRLELSDIEARLGHSRATGGASVNIADPHTIEAHLQLDAWPLRHPQLAELIVQADGAVNLTADLAAMALDGRVEVDSDLYWEQRLLARTEVQGRFEGQRLKLDSITAHLLEGRATGSGELHLTEPLLSELNLDIADIDAAALLPWAPQLEAIGGLDDGSLMPALDGLHGRLDGRLEVGPDDDPRAHGPFRITLQMQPRELSLQRIAVGPILFDAYIDADQQRFLLHKGRIDVADGRLNLWGRVTRQRDEWFVHAGLRWEELLIDQLLSLGDLLDPEADAQLPEDVADQPVPGRITGRMQAAMPLADWTRASGRGELSVAESDFVRIPMFNELYRLMNLRIRAGRADGRGEARLRLDGPTFRIERLDYTNRGARLNLHLAVLDLRKGQTSPIEGHAVGILNPLPDIRLLRDLADVIAAYQGDVTTARINGILKRPEVRPIPFSLFREFLGAVGGAVGLDN